MAHIPKRAVQHGVHLPSEEVSPPTLKLGQTALHSRGFYTNEMRLSTNSGRQESVGLQDRQHKSEYSKAISSSTRNEDYVNPVKPKRKPATEREAEGLERTGASHWSTEYRTTSHEGASRLATPRMTAEQILAGRTQPTPRSCVSRAPPDSCYLADFGRNGSNPRDSIQRDHTKLPLFKSALTAGTPRGTSHLPGYQGFIPSYPRGAALLRLAQGDSVRPAEKTNIIDIFHSNVVGYAGHEPSAVQNDFGGRKPTTQTTFGHDFIPHKSGALS
mmetsp:Transcript_62167/g.111979  ORF Transcript_62167/g.111979 Transcript_62167/m.111979 type:complete len:273 (+) Transcript_62167:84-902(+)